MEPAERDTIYKTHYWDVVKGDELPLGLDFCVFDASVNSGAGHAGIWLQQALGEAYRGTVDGIIGMKTLQAIEDHGDVEEIIAAFCAHRLATLERLATWGEFGKGWSARIANVQKTADAWASSSEAPHPVDVTSLGGHQKAPIVIAPARLSTAAAHVTTAAASAGALATSTASNLQPVQAALPDVKWIGYVMGGLAVVSAVAGFVVKTVNDARNEAAKGSARATVDIEADAALPQVPVNDNAPPPVSLMQSTSKAA